MTASADAAVERDLAPGLNRVVRGGALGIIGMITAALLNFALVAIVTRILPLRDAGIFFETVALFSILTTVATFGADTGFVRMVSRFLALRRVRDLRKLLVAGLVPVAMTGILIGLAIYSWTPQLLELLNLGSSRDTADFMRLLAPFIPVATIGWVALAGTRGFGSMITFVSLEHIGRPLLRPILILGASALGLGVGAVIVAWALPVAIQAPLALAFLWRLIRRAEGPDGSALRGGTSLRQVGSEFWRFAAVRGVSSFFQVCIQWLDVLLVGAILGPSAAGIYAVVSRLTLAGLLLLDGIRLALAPEISALLAVRDHVAAGKLYRTTAVWTVAAGWPIYLTLAVFAPVVLRWFGPEFVGGGPALQIVSIAMLFNMGTGNVGTVLLMGGKPSWNLYNTIVSVVLNVGLNLLLIPRLGIEGAAVAWAASIVFGNVAALVQIGWLMKIRLFARNYFYVVVFAIACYGGVGLLARASLGPGPGGLVVGVTAASVVYALAVYLSRDILQLSVLWESLRPRLRGPGRGGGGASTHLLDAGDA